MNTIIKERLLINLFDHYLHDQSGYDVTMLNNLDDLSMHCVKLFWNSNIFDPFTATGYFDIPPPRWPTFLAMLFHILKEGMGLSLLDELEVQYHVIKK